MAPSAVEASGSASGGPAVTAAEIATQGAFGKVAVTFGLRELLQDAPAEYRCTIDGRILVPLTLDRYPQKDYLGKPIQRAPPYPPTQKFKKMKNMTNHKNENT